MLRCSPTCRGLLLAAAMVALLAGPAQSLPRTLNMAVDPEGPPVTLPETLPNLAQSQGLDETTNGGVEQVHLTYWGSPDKMLVSFSSGTPTITPVPAASATRPDTSSKPCAVFAPVPSTQGPTAEAVESSFMNALSTAGGVEAAVASGWLNLQFGFSTSYVQDTAWPGYNYTVLNYVSGKLSHVLLTGLQPGTTYKYVVGASALGPWSSLFEFTTVSAQPTYPYTLGYIGDTGVSVNASQTVARLTATKPDLVMHLGDLSYADAYFMDGIYKSPQYPKALRQKLSDQRSWDLYGRMAQQLAAYVPVMTTPGNHEMEFQPAGTVFAAYNSRYPIPQTADPAQQAVPNALPAPGQTGSGRNMYYSVDLPGMAHLVFITAYIPGDNYGAASEQLQWLRNDLSAVNRTNTPWLILHMHAPWVTSWSGSFKDQECMRLAYEQELLNHNVDLVFSGHTHAYERFDPVYNFAANDCGPVHMTIGNGGKPGAPDGALDDQTIEAAYTDPKSICALSQSAWEQGNINNPTVGKACYTTQPNLGGFCWNAQPDFSAVRNAAFGMANLKLLNSTHAEWKYFRNQDAPGQAADTALIDRTPLNKCQARKRLA